MCFFDFHHHHSDYPDGIYSLSHLEEPPSDSSFFSVGIHPKDIVEASIQNSLDFVLKNITLAQCFAVGECGLDGLLSTDRLLQKEVFIKQIEWAKEYAKPMIIHCVRRHHDILHLNRKYQAKMIIHGYNAKFSTAKSLLDEGFYLSFGKAILFNLSLQKTLQSIPKNRFFLETDASDVPIDLVYHTAAKLLNVSIEMLVEILSENLYSISNG